MKSLSEKNQSLLILGAQTTGSFIDGYNYVEESLYIQEAEILYKFCQYLDNEIGGASSYNIKKLFVAFTQPNNKAAQKFAEEIKTTIQSYKI